MSTQPRTAGPRLRGRIRRRLLVNAVVDPDEAARQLPAPLRPHVTDQGTVVGCCLLEIDHIRPAGVPRIAGRSLRAAAHRISVEWSDDTAGDATQQVVGVYVPVRHTDARVAVAFGGRWFPGVHELATVEIEANEGMLRWVSRPLEASVGLDVRVEVSIPGDDSRRTAFEPVAATCLGADVGLSPDRRRRLEGARMVPEHRVASEVIVETLDAPFLSSFSTARPAPSYLMTDVDVTWTRAAPPRVGGLVEAT